MLAYLFWHRPAGGASAEAHEAAQRDLHVALAGDSASFRVDSLPFGDGGPGYEDWYLVADWAALGELNAAAVDPRRRPAHDRAAALAGPGWGGVYEPVRGVPEIPAGATWHEKPRGESPDAFLEALPGNGPVWRRQLVLGPAPEYCLATAPDERRHRVA